MKRIYSFFVISLLTVSVNAQSWVNIKTRDGRVISMQATPDLEMSWSNSSSSDQTGLFQKAPNALRLSLKNGTDRNILFTHLPKITHTDNGTVVLTDGEEKSEYKISDINKLSFFFNDGGSSLLKVFAGSKTQSGIYNLSGVKVEKIEKSGYYIINGTTVLVK